MTKGVKPRTRRYESSLRADQARETRRRIRAAAEGLFLARGWSGTSMHDVAKAAGVSRQTVFSAFGSKAGLLKEVCDVALAGDDAPLSLEERPDAQRVLATTDPAEAIRLHAKVVADVGMRVGHLWSVLAGGAGDPEVDKLLEFYAEGRLWGIGRIVDVLEGLGALRKRRSAKKAREAVWAVADPAAFVALMSRGWSRAEYERYLVETMTALLLD
jgi:AcrR family transcriptional regulator